MISVDGKQLGVNVYLGKPRGPRPIAKEGVLFSAAIWSETRPNASTPHGT
jgi:hypothetical protein